MNTKRNLGILTLLGVSLFFASCSEEEVSESEEKQEIVADEEDDSLFKEELAYAVDAPTTKIMYYGEEIEVADNDGEYVFGGDIIVEPDDPELAAKGVVRTKGLWPKNVVPYVIDKNVPNKSRIFEAMKHIYEKTGIRFTQRKKHKDYVRFRRIKSGCNSRLGRVGGRQDLNISDKCDRGLIIHEIGHALGMLHEMQRSDRDKFITIYWENIQKGQERNFFKAKKFGVKDPKDIGSFDYGSIMMYNSRAFAKSKKVLTMVHKRGFKLGAQRNGFSDGDVKTIKKLYKIK